MNVHHKRTPEEKRIVVERRRQLLIQRTKEQEKQLKRPLPATAVLCYTCKKRPAKLHWDNFFCCQSCAAEYARFNHPDESLVHWCSAERDWVPWPKERCEFCKEDRL